MIAINIALNISFKNNDFTKLIKNNRLDLNNSKLHLTLYQFYTTFDNIYYINHIISEYNNVIVSNIIEDLNFSYEKLFDDIYIYKLNIKSKYIEDLHNKIYNLISPYINTPNQLSECFCENITYSNLKNIVLDYNRQHFKPHITIGISDTIDSLDNKLYNISVHDINIHNIELFKIGNYGVAFPLYNPIYIAHRINTIKDLRQIPNNIGIELDLRDNNDSIHIIHDPFCKGENLNMYLKEVKHPLVIFNIKSERIELRILDYIKKYNIINYFFLDCSFPMIYKLSQLGCNNIAMRYSEYEPIESILLVKDMIKWVWVDCFNKFPLTNTDYLKIKNNGLKICIVSPELQNKDSSKIFDYKSIIKKNKYIIDAICTKVYNIDKWI